MPIGQFIKYYDELKDYPVQAVRVMSLCCLRLIHASFLPGVRNCHLGTNATRSDMHWMHPHKHPAILELLAITWVLKRLELHHNQGEILSIIITWISLKNFMLSSLYYAITHLGNILSFAVLCIKERMWGNWHDETVIIQTTQKVS